MKQSQSTCKVCSTPLPAHAGECRQCGAVYDEASRCPHCRALAGTELKGERFVCRICGGPRVPAFDRRVQRQGAERQALALAHTARRSARWRGAFAVLAAFFALLSTLVALTLGWLDAPFSTTSWLASALWFTATIVSWVLARGARQTSERAEARAWVDVAGEAVGSFPEVTETNLAELLGVPPARAEQLLTALVREERAESDIDEHARVVYHRPRVDAPALRLRVDERDDEGDEEAERDAADQVEPGRRNRV